MLLPSLLSRESTTLSPRLPQKDTSWRHAGSGLLLGGHLAHAARAQAFARHEHEPEQRHRHERDRVQHDRRADRGRLGARRRTSSPRSCRRRESRRPGRASAPRRRRRAASSRGTNPGSRTSYETRVTSPRFPSAIDSHSGNESASEPSRRAGCRMTARPCAKLSTSPATSRARFAGSTRSIRSAQAPEPLGMSGQEEEDDQPGDRRRRPPAARPVFTRAYSAGSPASDAGSTSSTNTPNSSRTVTRSSSRSRMTVAKHAVGGSCSRLRQQVRPQHLAGPRRQQEARGKADDRRLEGRRKPRRPDRRQQVLPAEGAQRIGHQRDADRQRRAGRASAWRVFAHTSARLTPRRKNASSPTVNSRTRAARSRDRM